MHGRFSTARCSRPRDSDVKYVLVRIRERSALGDRSMNRSHCASRVMRWWSRTKADARRYDLPPVRRTPGVWWSGRGFGGGVWARLAALLPDKPSQSVIALLHRYGVDCIFRTAPGEYDRLDAPTEARSHLRQRWYA